MANVIIQIPPNEVAWIRNEFDTWVYAMDDQLPPPPKDEMYSYATSAKGKISVFDQCWILE
jgi:hypothetical protein